MSRVHEHRNDRLYRNTPLREREEDESQVAYQDKVWLPYPEAGGGILEDEVLGSTDQGDAGAHGRPL
jgi:hypothetical protein